jgi:aromatic-L-amino-acid decarboxylase
LDDGLQPAQHGLGDMTAGDFRAAAHRVADIVADYLEGIERHRVVPDLQPGAIRARLPGAAPAGPEPLDAILADYLSLIEPNITHWQHPGFMAYFTAVACGPGILGEWLAAGLNSNVMFWRNAPASTELEEVVVAWLRQALGLPEAFDGMFTDTASVSTLTALVAARHATPGLDAREEGLAGRPGIARLRLYCSTEAHSSTDKAAIVIGVGRTGVRHIPADGAYAMRPDALAAAIREDRAAGWLPFCVVGMAGTTSSNGIDPLDEVADIARDERLWLHVDGAYGGAAALDPELRPLLAGWERADSIVVNPHKWMFTPFDASLLLFRRPDVFRDAFSLVPEYLRAADQSGVHNYHEYGIQLGRRFRALKLWMMLRYFGLDGMAARVRESVRMARRFADAVRSEPGWEVLAPVPFSTVCFRHLPGGLAGLSDEDVDRHNEAVMARVNQAGDVLLSHTRLAGRYAIRLTLGNLRQTDAHVDHAWSRLRAAAAGRE